MRMTDSQNKRGLANAFWWSFLAGITGGLITARPDLGIITFVLAVGFYAVAFNDGWCKAKETPEEAAR